MLQGNNTVSELPQYLQAKVMLHVNRDMVTQVPVFSRCSEVAPASHQPQRDLTRAYTLTHAPSLVRTVAHNQCAHE